MATMDGLSQSTDAPDVETVVSTLREHAVELRAAGIRRLSLFGSVARGEAKPDSDVDLLAELDPEAHIGLFGLVGLELKLGEILGRKVDLSTEPVRKDYLRANIERDRRVVF
jgi:uncharacterized protein